MNVQNFIAAVLGQDAGAMRKFFFPGAYINWHNTDEHFTVEDYIRANCEYPGDGTGEIEKIIQKQDMLIVVTRVCSTDFKISCHCTSFIQGSDDGDVPQRQKEKHIGTRIK